jgi:hypothetical protein
MDKEKEKTLEESVPIDFTAYKLINMATYEHDPIQREVLLSMLDLYNVGVISIAWKDGLPFAEIVEN